MKSEDDFAGRQVAGARITQDDYYGFCPLNKTDDGLDGLLLVLADGMGGYEGGAIASRIVVEAFVEHFCFSRGDLGQRLLTSVKASIRQLHEEIARREAHLRQMGSTLVGVVLTEKGLVWVSVGDSGLYIFRDGKVRRINADHSMAPVLAEQVALGKMRPEEAAHHPDRNVLRSAICDGQLGMYELRDIPFELRPSDVVFAATDGLASVEPDVLTAKMQVNSGKPAARIAEALLIAVNEVRYKKQDNATVAVIRNPLGAHFETSSIS